MSEQQKLADKIVKDWAKEHMPKFGLKVKDEKFHTGEVIVKRETAKPLNAPKIGARVLAVSLVQRI